MVGSSLDSSEPNIDSNSEDVSGRRGGILVMTILSDELQEKFLIKCLLCDWKCDYDSAGWESTWYATKGEWQGKVVRRLARIPTEYRATVTTPSGSELILSSDRAKVLFEVIWADAEYKQQLKTKEADAKCAAEIRQCIGDY